MKPLIISRKCKYCKIVKPSNEFYRDRANPLGFGYGCKKCLTEFQREYNKKNRKMVTEKTRIKRQNIKKLLVAENGGKCFVCGYNKYIGALDFHHKDPNTKDFSVGRLSGINMAREECKKCILLCSNCHNEVHGGITKIS